MPFRRPPFLLILVVLFFSYPAMVWAQALVGKWSGEVFQLDPDDSYLTQIVLDGSKGKIDYPSLKCGGKLRLIKTQGSSHIYREILTYGRNNCIDKGTVTLIPTGDLLQWEWRKPGQTWAHGFLNKIKD